MGPTWFSLSDRQFVPTDSAQNIYQTQESASRSILHIKSYDNRTLAGGGDDGRRLECRATPTSNTITTLENGSEFCLGFHDLKAFGYHADNMHSLKCQSQLFYNVQGVWKWFSSCHLMITNDVMVTEHIWEHRWCRQQFKSFHIQSTKKEELTLAGSDKKKSAAPPGILQALWAKSETVCWVGMIPTRASSGAISTFAWKIDTFSSFDAFCHSGCSHS